MRGTGAGGFGLLPGIYLLITRKGKRALATALGRLPKARVIKALPTALPTRQPKTEVRVHIHDECTSRGTFREKGLAAAPLLL